MTDGELALAILRKIATHDDCYMDLLDDTPHLCIDTGWTSITEDQAALVRRLLERG